MSRVETARAETAGGLLPLNPANLTQVSIDAGFGGFDVAEADSGLYFARWDSLRSGAAFYGRPLPEEYSKKKARRDPIDKVVQLTPEFSGATSYSLAHDELKSVEHWLEDLRYDDEVVAANSLPEQIKQRRLRGCTEQVAELNGLIAQDTDLHVMTIEIRRGDSEPRYFMASLKGLFITSDGEGKPEPGLILADNYGSIGAVPEGHEPFGIYVKAGEN